ncbi:MAG: 16S rRNA (guanine(527)-N(7))-methyltransferase RsmG [Deltaproteobacteria bacterium]|jgi:16S rRNA (guanine527-N7)-methyltransferase|nr:16S rRNA (guanine(527)-N(7))-methyltransferase RsmG [Deltaproteobacteria bacterium]
MDLIKATHILESSLKELDLNFSEDVISRLIKYWSYVFLFKQNLNIISKKTDFYKGIELHILDSLSILKNPFPLNQSILDLGSGGGFPGIVLSLARPLWDVTLFEAKAGKCNFLKAVKNKLNLSNVKIFQVILTSLNKENLNFFDLITTRAVDSMFNLVPIISPILKEGGFYIVYQGPNFQKDLQATKDILPKYNLKLVDITELVLPLTQAKRNLIVFQKI